MQVRRHPGVDGLVVVGMETADVVIVVLPSGHRVKVTGTGDIQVADPGARIVQGSVIWRLPR